MHDVSVIAAFNLYPVLSPEVYGVLNARVYFLVINKFGDLQGMVSVCATLGRTPPSRRSNCDVHCVREEGLNGTNLWSRPVSRILLRSSSTGDPSDPPLKGLKTRCCIVIIQPCASCCATGTGDGNSRPQWRMEKAPQRVTPWGTNSQPSDS